MKNHRRTVILCLITLIVTAAAFATTKLQEPQKKQLHELPESATPIQEGVMTEKQREHSKIFRGLDSHGGGKKIKDLVAAQGDVNVWGPLDCGPYMPLPDLSQFLTTMACEADAVVLGFVNSKSSNLTDAGNFLFTDYEVTVKEALKTNAAAPFAPGEQITVTRSGGAVMLNGHVVRAINQNQKNLQIGKFYLLYLRYIPKTGAYRQVFKTLSEDTFLLEGEQASQLSRQAWPFGEHGKHDASTFLNMARQAAANSCERRR